MVVAFRSAIRFDNKLAFSGWVSPSKQSSKSNESFSKLPKYTSLSGVSSTSNRWVELASGAPGAVSGIVSVHFTA